MGMSTLKLIATILYIVVCIALIIVVLMQEGKTSGLGAIGGAADTYWSKNKGKYNKYSRQYSCHFNHHSLRRASFVL